MNIGKLHKEEFVSLRDEKTKVLNFRDMPWSPAFGPAVSYISSDNGVGLFSTKQSFFSGSFAFG